EEIILLVAAVPVAAVEEHHDGLRRLAAGARQIEVELLARRGAIGQARDEAEIVARDKRIDQARRRAAGEEPGQRQKKPPPPHASPREKRPAGEYGLAAAADQRLRAAFGANCG